jgi:hypothetical protein
MRNLVASRKIPSEPGIQNVSAKLDMQGGATRKGAPEAA